MTALDPLMLPLEVPPRRRLTTAQVRGWLGSVKYAALPDIEPPDCSDLIHKIRCGENLVPFDGDMPQADSDDSYNRFVTRKHFRWCWNEAQVAAHSERRQKGYAAQAAYAQAEWEAQQRARQEAREEAARLAWEAEEAKRAAAKAKREAATAARMTEFIAACRAFWVGHPAVDEPLLRVRVVAAFTLPVGDHPLVFKERAECLVPCSVAHDLAADGWVRIEEESRQ